MTITQCTARLVTSRLSFVRYLPLRVQGEALGRPKLDVANPTKRPHPTPHHSLSKQALPLPLPPLPLPLPPSCFKTVNGLGLRTLMRCEGILSLSLICWLRL